MKNNNKEFNIGSSQDVILYLCMQIDGRSSDERNTCVS